MDLALLERAKGLMNLQPQSVSDFPQPVNENVDVTAPPQQPNLSVQDRMNQLYHPRDEANRMLTTTLGQMPQRSDYKPSGVQRVLASIAGAGSSSPAEAFTTSRGIVSRPYDEALGDWQNKVKPQEFLAQTENNKNKEQFNIADKTIDNELNQRKEHDIFTTKVADLERKIKDGEDKAKQWERKFNEDQSNHQALINLKETQLEIERRKSELLDLQHKATLAEITRKHTADIEAEKTKSKDYEARTDLWKEYNKDRLAGKDVSTYVFDKDGQLQGKKTISTEQRVRVIDKNGNPGTVPASQLADALKKGFKKAN